MIACMHVYNMYGYTHINPITTYTCIFKTLKKIYFFEKLKMTQITLDRVVVFTELLVVFYSSNSQIP